MKAVMAGFSPAIHDFLRCPKSKDVDGPNKSGHDEKIRADLEGMRQIYQKTSWPGSARPSTPFLFYSAKIRHGRNKSGHDEKITACLAIRLS